MKIIKGRKVILSIVSLILGFMVAFSYNLTKQKQREAAIVNQTWDREYELRKQLIEQEKVNRKLSEELRKKQAQVTNIEKDLSQEKESLFKLAEEAEKYRMFLGKIKVRGPGLSVTLSDGTAAKVDDNINDYLVHEQHVFKVINELYISGAEAVAVNGQRLNHDSYIVCNGPVITVDGQQYPAPFVITAIGNTNVLEASLNLAGGVKDQLVNENIIFTILKQNEVEMEPIFSS
ncbi:MULTISPECIES: DUF881 domain-containing protein [Bacillaceae]|uniref:Uncharacterized protein YlxW (UPF0749 family) n=1 Tax=Peribacillus huizhouensis TaxID=1501239 RepID=A0ABR6CIT9_9BACI|nr:MULTISPECIES: DUF881 domain-containing protein [Bacillaceae]MBA9024959.1 uncharacterized protein YlxW (UPF0749 family) [Peribacillus huizhouensis]